MRYMQPKPGQSAPQMTPRGPRGPIKNPGGVRAAANPKTPRDIGFGNRPNTTGTPVGRPKAVNTGPRTPPPSTNVNPVRPRGGMGMTGGPKPINPAIGAKKGGKVSSKMGAVKTSAKPDGIAQRGKTKGAMPKMARGGKTY